MLHYPGLLLINPVVDLLLLPILHGPFLVHGQPLLGAGSDGEA